MKETSAPWKQRKRERKKGGGPQDFCTMLYIRGTAQVDIFGRQCWMFAVKLNSGKVCCACRYSSSVSNVVFNVWRLAENRPVIKVSSCAYQHLNLKFKGKLSKALQKYLKYKTAYPFQYVHLYTGLLHWHPEAKGASKLRLPCSLQRQGPSHYIRGFMTL